MSSLRFFSRFVSRDLARRDLSLDVFRGLMIVGMILVNHRPPDAPIYAPFVHAAWHGWTLADTIFPGFLFAVGVSIRVAMSDERGRPLAPSASLLNRLFVRFGVLMLLNFLLVNFPYYLGGQALLHWHTGARCVVLPVHRVGLPVQQLACAGGSCPLAWCTSRGSRKVGNSAQLITAESLAG